LFQAWIGAENTYLEKLALCISGITNNLTVLVMNKRCTSVHSAGIEQIHEMPLNEIIRPIPPQVDEGKVQSLMDTLSVSVLQYLMM